MYESASESDSFVEVADQEKTVVLNMQSDKGSMRDLQVVNQRAFTLNSAYE